MAALAEKGNDVESLHKVTSGNTAAFGVCNTYATILVKYWFIICIIIFAMMAAYGTIAFTLYELPDFTDPVKGFDARGTDISARLRSVTNMLYHSADYLSQQVIIPGGYGSSLLDTSNAYVGLPTLTCSPPDVDTNNSIWFGASLWEMDEQLAKVIFEGVDGRDMLTASSLKSVCSTATDLISSHPLYEAHCLCHGVGECPSAWSLGNYVALLSNKTSCQEITDSDAERVVGLLEKCTVYFHNRSRSELLASGDAVPAECAQHDYAIHTMLFYLLPLDFTDNIGRNETVNVGESAVFFPLELYEVNALQTIYTDNLQRCSSCSDGITELKAVDFSLKFSLFATLLLADSLFLGIGILLVFLLIWLYTGSFVITVAALLNIAFSVLMAYFFFTVVFARPFFPFSNVLAAVLVIGVGADDAFVFVDLWKKCRQEQAAGDLVGLTREALRHATVTMFVTSFTTAAALFASTISDITAVKCFGIFAGMAILMNLLLTLSLTPAFAVLDHKLTDWIKRCRGEQRRRPGQTDRSVPGDIHTTADEESPSCRQRLIKFGRGIFEEILPSVVVRLRYLWMVVLLLLSAGGAVAIFYQPGVKLPTIAENQFLVISHHFEQYDFIYKERFAFANKNRPYVPAYIIWGVEDVDNGNNWDPDDLGTFSPREDFTFSAPSDQEWMLDFCQDLRNQSFFNSDEPNDCFIDTVKSLMERPCVANPFTGQDASPCCGQSAFPYPASVFDVCVSRFYSAGYIPSVRFTQGNSTLAVITLPFTMAYKQTLSYAVNDELWTSTNEWVQSKLSSAAEHLQHGWFCPFTVDIAFYDLQRSLASGTTLSMLVTLAIGSTILLLSIQNVILTINAVVTITSTVFVTVGSLILLGWELNIVESTVITLSVGLSVDFTIHYGVAYRLAPHADRRKRTLYSLSTMSGAISIAALSTFTAGALVMPATVYGYTQFGIFLMIVMSVSWAYSTFLFQSLCYSFGPQNAFGDLPCSTCFDCFGYKTGPENHPEASPSPGKQVSVRKSSPTSANERRLSSQHHPPTKNPTDRRYSGSVAAISGSRFLPIYHSEQDSGTGTISEAAMTSSSRTRSVYGTESSRRHLQHPLSRSNHRHSLGGYEAHHSFAPYPHRTLDNNNSIPLSYSEVHYNPMYNGYRR